MTDSSAAVRLPEGIRDAGLRRGIGAFGLAAAIVNIVVGAGIFTLPAGMARAAGPYALVAYLLCALAMGAVVLCFAEAGSRVPTSGGTYGYVEAAFGPLAGFVAGVLLWLSCVLAAGGIAAAFTTTLGRLAPALQAGGARAVVILAVVGTLTLVNLAGAGRASRLIAVTTVVKLVPLLMFIVVGALFVAPARLSQGVAPDASGIGRAVLLSLFAFQGMETVLGASGEVADPARTLPRGLIGAMAFVVIAYVAIQLVAQGLLGGALAGSTAPLADAIATVDPRLGLLLVVGATVSMGFWLGSDLLGAPRVLFAFARDGFLPAALGRVSPRTGVPATAILVHAGLAAVLAITGTFETLVVLSVLSACGLYAAGCAAAWVLRR
ncbi:APC family permease, partial [Sphingomonas bacterium]|uniref:APC family permease n=1 Tax=Sphingomonas bacterium TaxID=1895847 RepID=UPI001575C3DE